MLEVKGLTYFYGEDMALRDVTFSLPQGQICGLLGENGAGKTTLMRCVLGLLKPSSGQATLDGEPVFKRLNRVSYISGEGACVGNLTPKETGDFFAGLYPAFNRERYDKLLDFFELPSRPVRNMSKGERAKAELSLGFSRGGDYILMDEPFGGKDVFTRRDFLKVMAGILEPNETVLLSTHLVEEVELFLDRALVLHKGKLAADADMEQLRQNGKNLIGLLLDTTGYDEARVTRYV